MKRYLLRRLSSNTPGGKKSNAYPMLNKVLKLKPNIIMATANSIDLLKTL